MGVLLRSEVLRIYRSPRFLIFTVGIPVLYFLIFSEVYGGDGDGDTIVGLMVSMSAFGAIAASVSTGGRVAVERGVGWNRQLRLTPLPGWGYLVVKAAVAMLVALPTLALVFAAAGLLKGVELDPITWLRVFVVAWVGVLPFAAIGLLIGMLATPDSAQAMSTVTMLLFSFLGGVFIPASVLPPVMATIAQALPSYWLVDSALGQASGGGISAEGVAVVLAWVVGAGVLVAVRYRSDSARV